MTRPEKPGTGHVTPPNTNGDQSSDAGDTATNLALRDVLGTGLKNGGKQGDGYPDITAGQVFLQPQITTLPPV